MTSKERHARRYARRVWERMEKRAHRAERHGLNEITETGAVYSAYKKECASIGWKLSCQLFGQDIINNTFSIIERFNAGKCVHDGYAHFTIRERGKLRHIQSPSVREKIAQKVLCLRAVKPCVTPSLIYDNGASIKGKGVAFARKRLVGHLSSFYRAHGPSGYILLVDMRHYFDCIDHRILLQMYDRYIPDERVKSIIAQYVRAGGGEKGCGIGSELSQISALLYLNIIDHTAKDRYRIKRYGRFTDDFYAISESREQLEALLADIRRLSASVKMTVNERKVKLLPLSAGFTFMKTYYKFSEKGRVLKLGGREAWKRQRRKLKAQAEKVRAGALSQKQVWQEYTSWRKSTLKTFDCYALIQEADRFYKELFT